MLKKEIQLAKRKGHNIIMVYNDCANCINILDISEPNKLSQRLGFQPYDSETWDEGICFRQLIYGYNEFLGSWKGVLK